MEPANKAMHLSVLRAAGDRQTVRLPKTKGDEVIQSRGLNIAIAGLGLVFLAWCAVSVSFAAIMGEPSSPGAIIIIGAVGLWAAAGGIANLRSRKPGESEKGTVFITKCGHVFAWAFLAAFSVCVVALTIWGFTASLLAERIGMFAGAALVYLALIAILSAGVWVVMAGIGMIASHFRRSA